MNNQLGIMPEYDIMGECLANSENKAPFLNAKEQSSSPLEHTISNVKKRCKYLKIRRIFASLLLVCTGALVSNAQNTTATKLTTSNVPQQSTIYGVLSTRPDLDLRLNAANNLLVNYERETQILTRWNGTKNTYIDYWLDHNKKVILNINNDTTPSPFPKNLTLFESRFRSVLDAYGSKIELAVIENEELNSFDSVNSVSGLYHFGSMQDYINELTVAVNVCVEKGVPVTNGGITTQIVSSLRNYYIKNNLQDSLTWLVTQMNGVTTDSLPRLRCDSLLNAYKTLPLSYVNLHWYEPLKGLTRSTGVLQVLCNYITQQTGKSVVSNETGVKTSDSSFVTQILRQWDSANVKYCIFFDGAGAFGANPLTNDTGALIANGAAFRNYAFGATYACPQTISINPPGPIKSCSGLNVTLTAAAGFGNYLWSNGATTRSIVVNTPNNYYVTSTKPSCVTFPNNVVSMIVNPLPAKPVISPNSPLSEVCPSKTVKLTCSPSPNYNWNTGDTTKILSVTTQGAYGVTVTDANGCKNTSDTVVVTFQKCNAPTNLFVSGISKTKATLNWDTAVCAIGYQFQYRQKGTTTWTVVQINGGGTSFRNLFNLLPTTTYQWKILTGCKTNPDTVSSNYATGPEFTTTATFTSAINTSEERMVAGEFNAIIFPTIVTDNVTVSLTNSDKAAKIILTDLSGKVFWQSEKISDKNIKIPVSNLAKGIYMLKVSDNEHSKTLKFVKG